MKYTQSSKQRVLTALSHRTPDRTPCNYLGTPEINQVLLNHFQTDSMDTVLDRLGVDLRVIEPVYIGPELRKWPDGRFETLWGHVRKPVVNQAGTYNESVEFPYAKFQSVEEVRNFRWPRASWFDYSVLTAQCERYKDFAIVYGATWMMDLLNGTSYGRGVEQIMYDLALEDPVGLECMSQRFQSCIEISQAAFRMAGDKIDIFWIGDDLGTQKGLVISPAMFRKHFFDKLKAFCDLGHQYGAKVMMHSCGSTRKLWPDLIDAGVDIYDTVQPEASDMNPESLKREFGEQICFHGTISTQKTLPFGSPEEVKNEVLQRIRTVGKNGGLILAPAHNIQPDTPLENILAMYETVRQSA